MGGLRDGVHALAAEFDGLSWVLARLVLGADLNVAAFGSALHQNRAVTFSEDNYRLLALRTSFDGRARNRFAGRFAALALIIMDDDLVTFWTFRLFDLRAWLLLARPCLAASVGFFEELVTSSVAGWRSQGFARRHDFGVASASICSLHHFIFTDIASVDWIGNARLGNEDGAVAFAEGGFAVDQLGHLAVLLGWANLNALENRPLAFGAESLRAFLAIRAWLRALLDISGAALPLLAAAFQLLFCFHWLLAGRVAVQVLLGFFLSHASVAFAANFFFADAD